MKNEVDVKDKKKNLAKVILLVIAIPILIALGVVIGGYISSMNNASGVTQEEEEEVLTEQTVILDQFVLNLEPMGNINRYIRLELALSTTQETGVETIENNMNKIRDVIIFKISKDSIDDVFEVEEEEDKNFALKRDLKEEINEALGDEVIHQVYISNIVIQ